MPQIGETIAYNATYTPSNATTPVTFAWSISPSSAGTISNPSAASTNITWNETGTHTINLSTTNCGGTQTSSKSTTITAVPMYYTMEPCQGGTGERSQMTVADLPIGTIVKSNGGICYSITGTSSTITSNIIESVETSCNSCLGISPVTPVTPSPAPAAPSPSPAACIPISDFNYTINGVANTNGFTLVGVQDVNIEVTDYTPSNASGPITYDFILGDFSTGVSSSNTKSFPSVNEGGHVLTIIAYNCTGNTTKTINFGISAAPSPAAPSPSPVAPSPVAPTPAACIPITGRFIGGPSSVVVDNGATFDATYSPNDASGPISYQWFAAAASDSVLGSNTGSSADFIFGSNGGPYPQEHYISCTMWNGCTAPLAESYTVTVLGPAPSPAAPSPAAPSPAPSSCIPVSTFDYRVGIAINPSGTVNIPLGAEYAIDINPTGSYDGPVTFKVTIYGDHNNFLYMSDPVMSPGSLVPGSPLFYTFDDTTATSVYISVFNCGGVSNFISIPVSVYVP